MKMLTCADFSLSGYNVHMHLGLRQLLILLWAALSIANASFAQAQDIKGKKSKTLRSPAKAAVGNSELMAKDQSSEHATDQTAEPVGEQNNAIDSLSGSRSYPYSKITEDDFQKNNPLVPYAERRGTWGALLSVNYSNYSPEDYRPDFVVSENYEQFYGEVDAPMIDVTVAAKLNASFFSLSLDLGGGYFQNNGRFGSVLTLAPIRLGATLALDGLMSEPYLVPYGSAGLYSVIYSESLASQKVEGRTKPAPYFAAGLRLQLDWIDPQADDEALLDFGLENTFVFVEGRYFAASGDIVPDVSSPDDSPYMVNVGLALEF